MTTMRPTGVGDLLDAASKVGAAHDDLDELHRAAVERAAVELPDAVESIDTESTAH